MKNNSWSSFKSAQRSLASGVAKSIQREFGTAVKVQRFAVEVDREDFTGKLTYSTVMVKKPRKKLGDIIAVLIGRVWRFFTNELQAQKAFFASLKPNHLRS